MASVDELRSIFQNTKVQIVEETEDAITLRLMGLVFYILKSEVDDYVKIKDVVTAEPETSIYYPGYYEHLLEIQAPMPIRRIPRGEDENSRQISQDENLSLCISSPSLTFVLKILSTVEPQVLRRRVFIGYSIREKAKVENGIHISEAFARLNTIKVQATEKSTYFTKKPKLYKIAEAGLFNLAYGYGAGYNLSQSWERTIYRLRHRRQEAVQFPRRTYNSDLVSYYQLALSSDSLMLGFLALYKILEYFYLSAAENELHKRLIERLISPDFVHTKVSQLRSLTALIRKHDQRMDEQRMLVTVLEHYFMPDEISNWVTEYEKSEEPYFTVPQDIFGQTFVLDLNPDTWASSLAKRIYYIRNVIVHNKEGEAPRFIPFSGQEKVLSKEISIVLFIAEQLILKTGDDL